MKSLRVRIEDEVFEKVRHLPWIRKGYKDYYVEGFHFGYKIEILPTGEQVVVVYESCHELLFY